MKWLGRVPGGAGRDGVWGVMRKTVKEEHRKRTSFSPGHTTCSILIVYFAKLVGNFAAYCTQQRNNNLIEACLDVHSCTMVGLAVDDDNESKMSRGGKVVCSI